MVYIGPEQPQPVQKRGNHDIKYELAPSVAARGPPTMGAETRLSLPILLRIAAAQRSLTF